MVPKITTIHMFDVAELSMNIGSCFMPCLALEPSVPVLSA